MPGPIPKHHATRQRTNRTATAATFETDEQVETPELGTHPVEGEEWHPRTLDFWREVWGSPMRDEYLKADIDGLFQLAALVDAFWKKPSAGLASEIRLQRQCYGLTPIDRRRLQWEVVRAETARRRPVPAPRPQVGDPRGALKAL